MAINFISTALNMRTDGMLLHKMSLKINNILNNNNRNYSNNLKIKKKMNKNEFNQWFVGFSDGESSFYITEDNRGKKTRFYFRFIIGLHIDDKPLLEFIKTELGCGSINIKNDKTACYFTVADLSDINKILIPIFDSFSLNTTKYLDYLSFKQALSINNLMRKTASLGLSEYAQGKIENKYIKEILELKNSMNTKRTNFVLPLNHIKITSYWLLGLIEGEGSFHLWRTSLTPVFSISLTKVQQPVIEKIVEFLTNNLDKHSQFKANNTKVFNLKIEKAKGNTKAKINLAIFQIDYLFNIFIPFLESLNFQSKKKLDFNDFKLITTLIYQGKHLKSEIKSFILKVSYTMNNFRLTTSKNLSNNLPSAAINKNDNFSTALAEPSFLPSTDQGIGEDKKKDCYGTTYGDTATVLTHQGEALTASKSEKESIDLFSKTKAVSNHLSLKICAADIERYLNLPPVYIKTNEGRIINIETGDLVRDTFVVEVIKADGTILLFSTVTACALFFNISRSVIYTKLANGDSIESLNISKFNKIRVFNFIELPYKVM